MYLLSCNYSWVHSSCVFEKSYFYKTGGSLCLLSFLNYAINTVPYIHMGANLDHHRVYVQILWERKKKIHHKPRHWRQRPAYSSGLWVQSSYNRKVNKNAKWSNSRFCCMWVFWFPQTKSLDGFSATWNMTRHPLFCTCALLSQPAPYGPCCLQTPKSFPEARGCFCGNHYIAPLPQRDGVTMMSNHSQNRLSASNSDRIFNNWPYLLCWPNC